MQIMPDTANDLGIENSSDPIESIKGGTTYLNQIYKRFDEVKDTLNRAKLTLAAYNCGYGHVKDAQRLAKAYGHNPLIWTDNVDKNVISTAFSRKITISPLLNMVM